VWSALGSKRQHRWWAPGEGNALLTDREDLLDIKQAAQFLKVSETSLRRWTNSAQLACLRVGRKRERRFRRADLLAFAEHQPAAALATHGSRGVTGTPGDHLCGLYASDLSRVHLAAAFLADGLEVGTVSYLAAGPEVRKQVVGHLERRRPSVQADIEAGRLVLSAYAASVPAQCDYWETGFAAAAGAHSLRVVGDVSGGDLGQRLSWHEVVEYERSYDQLAQRFGVATLCLYDVRNSSGLQVLDVLKCHQDVFQHPVDRLFS
jgi:excisionase family DNA binding protein